MHTNQQLQLQEIRMAAELLIPGLVFFISCHFIAASDLQTALLFSCAFAAIFYLSKLAGSQWLRKLLLVRSRVLANLLTTATGILIACLALLIAGWFVATPNAFGFTLIFSAILAFLILGTLSPLIKSDK